MITCQRAEGEGVSHHVDLQIEICRRLLTGAITKWQACCESALHWQTLK